MEEEKIWVCACHDEQVPLIWTFVFNGAECWCPACGFQGGMFESGEEVPLTKKLEKSIKFWSEKTEEFLDAKGTLACHSKEINGVEVMRKDIPKDEIDRCQKIVDSWEYQIKR
jgi:hypothetical protein